MRVFGLLIVKLEIELRDMDDDDDDLITKLTHLTKFLVGTTIEAKQLEKEAESCREKKKHKDVVRAEIRKQPKTETNLSPPL